MLLTRELYNKHASYSEHKHFGDCSSSGVLHMQRRDANSTENQYPSKPSHANIAVCLEELCLRQAPSRCPESSQY